LFVPLYSANVNYTNSGVVTTLRETRGLLQGWVTLTNSPLRGATGTIAWIKPAVDGDVFYPAGFTQTMELLGSGYVAPASGQRALMLTNGVVVLAGGNLPAPVTNRVVLATNNLMTVLAPVNGLQLTLTPKTGLFKGSFAHPAKPGVPTAFSGALLQNQNVGAGFFAGTNLSGAIWLSPE
jgi:hypothetical protein